MPVERRHLHHDRPLGIDAAGRVAQECVQEEEQTERDVRAIDLFVRSDATQLSELVARVDRGELTVDVTERVPLADLGAVHANAAAGTLAGKVVVLVAST